MGRFRGLLAGTSLLCAIWSGGASLAASPSISTTDSTAAQTYLADLDSMIGKQRSDSNVAFAHVTKGTGDVIWFDPLKDRANAFGYNRITGSDAEWMRSNVRLYEIYEQLGGNEVGREQQFRNGAQGFYVGLDGYGGRWFSSNGDAQGYLFKLLIGASSEILPAVKTAVAQVTSNDIGTVLTVARDAMAANRTFVARGSNNTLIIRGSGYGVGSVAPKVAIPNGVTITGVTYVSTEEVRVDIAVAADAKLGDRPVLLFNPGNAIDAIIQFGLVVVRGSGTPSLGTDDHGDTIAAATTLTLGTTQTGFVTSPSDTDLFKIVVPAPGGTLTLESGGTTDLVGELLDSSGTTVLLSNDDGGNGYNFKLVRAGTGAGTYYLRVKHCCVGGGPYTVSAGLN